jgi:hypothetical protein
MTFQITINAEDDLPKPTSLLTENSKKRYTWLIEATPIADKYYFAGGKTAYSLFKASRYCYVYGHFLASLVFGLAYIEITLFQLLKNGHTSSDLEKKLSILSKEALIHGFISDEVYEFIEYALRLRNQFPAFNQNVNESNKKARHHDNHFQIQEPTVKELMGIMMNILLLRSGPE